MSDATGDGGTQEASTIGLDVTSTDMDAVRPRGRPGRRPKGSVPHVVAELPDKPDPDHVLTWRGRLDVSSDARTFFYKYTRTLLRDGVVIRTRTWEEPIARDHQ